jgi:WD40 repeat protein
MHRIAAAAIALALGGTPALTGALRQLRFSPDGGYVLAQDYARITVLTVQPFSVLFRIEAMHSNPATFTVDSREIVFLSRTPNAGSGLVSHIERWSIASRARVALVDIPDAACQSERLSPNGDVLACVDSKGTLHLTDVASGAVVLELTKFGRQRTSYERTCSTLPTVGMPDDSRAISGTPCLDSSPAKPSGNPGAAAFSFSPDGRFVVAIPSDRKDPAVAFDFREKETVKLRGGLKGIEALTYVAPDRVMVSRSHHANTLLAFPSGEVVSNLDNLPEGKLSPATDPAVVIVTGKVTSAVDYRTGQVVATGTAALDVSDKLYVLELPSGALSLSERGKPPVTPTSR